MRFAFVSAFCSAPIGAAPQAFADKLDDIISSGTLRYAAVLLSHGSA